MLKILIIATLIGAAKLESSAILKDLHDRYDLDYLLIDLLNVLIKDYEVTCMAIICDEVYLNVFAGPLFKRTPSVPFVMTVVEDYEDLLSPNFVTLESLKEARKEGCNVYVILLANGLQAARLLRFGDRHRVLDTRAKYIMLHDFRLFHSELHYIWRRIVNIIFIKHHKKVIGIANSKAWFDLSTVPFPNPITGVFVPRRVDIWKNENFHYKRPLFADKTSNLNGEVLNVVYLDHVPSVVVVKNNASNKIGGVEVEILHTLAEKMNFKPRPYQAANTDTQKWGHKQANGTFSGLLGEMVNGKADIALGNLQYTPYHLELTDLSIPYTSQCWTFLTPEALTDNSWKTLILPFKLYMWIAVLLVLLITGTIFYGLAKSHMNLQEYKKDLRSSKLNKDDNRKKTTVVRGDAMINPTMLCQSEFDLETLDDQTPDTFGATTQLLRPVLRTYGFIMPEHDESLGGKTLSGEKPALYLFGEIINSILYTYGMLLVVSLPRLPVGWSIRLLTGWYWLYCILLVVSYRASMTAILANPAPRVTIDTLQELVDSKVTCGGWGTQTKMFFQESLDEYSQSIGEKFETIDDPLQAADKVAQGVYAYYDNADFLKYISVTRKNSFKDSEQNNTSNVTGVTARKDNLRNLHIMTDCVVNIPISIGFHKNSPLKPLVDIYMWRVVEVGLVEKWLNDAMYSIRTLEANKDEVKALMNLQKLYGAFIALAIGYSFSAVCLIGELIHWHIVVKRDPKFDKYALDLYYKNKNKKH